MKRYDVLAKAGKCVCGERDECYGKPEDSFTTIAKMWNAYLGALPNGAALGGKDVAAMMALLKVARIATGVYKADNWVDLAGYAACGGELEAAQGPEGGYASCESDQAPPETFPTQATQTEKPTAAIDGANETDSKHENAKELKSDHEESVTDGKAVDTASTDERVIEKDLPYRIEMRRIKTAKGEYDVPHVVENEKAKGDK